MSKVPRWRRPAESGWRIRPSEENDPAKVERALVERIKELNCLYGIAQCATRCPDSIDALLEGVVEILPPSWQFPEVTCARIRFQGAVYRSTSFRVTRWRQSARILVHNKPVGEVEVFYLEERPPAYDGPFLREEVSLINVVAEQIGTHAMRIFAEQELQEINKQLNVEREALKESNAALRTVLARIEDEKREIKSDIHANVEKVLLPILHALAVEVPRSQRKYVDILRDSLEEITAPFANKVSRSYKSLTPTEVSICNMIRSGLRTKEIAELRGVSPQTVHRHREHIRRKLGLCGKDVNLTTHLQMLT